MKHGWTLAAGLLLPVCPLAAHHDVAKVDDVTRVVTLTGVITHVEWTNPHTIFFLDVKDQNGEVAHWWVEASPPNSLKRQGVTKDSVPPGVEMTAGVWAAKDGSPHADATYGSIVKLSNGVSFKIGTWTASGKSVFPGPPAAKQ